MKRQLPLIILAITYPAAVCLGLQWLQPRSVATLLALATLTRALVHRQQARWALCLGGLSLSAVAFFANVALPLKLYPVMMNIFFLGVFGFSLWRPPTLVQQLALRGGAFLDAQGLRYTRAVTWVWCFFFLFNGTLALACGLWASARLWALYNGFISYLLMGLLFLGEFMVRQRMRARGNRG